MAAQKQQQSKSQPNELLKLAKKATEYADLKDTINKAEVKLKQLRSEIIPILKGMENHEFILQSDDEAISEYKLKLVQLSSIDFNMALLEKKLTKEQKKKLISKKVEILEWEKFAEFMKKHGISADDIKGFLGIQKVVDKDILQNMHQVGEINLSQISDCYTLNIKEQLRLTERKVNSTKEKE